MLFLAVDANAQMGKKSYVNGGWQFNGTPGNGFAESALEYIENYNNCNNAENYEAFQDIGLDDDEIEALGFDYLIEEADEE